MATSNTNLSPTGNAARNVLSFKQWAKLNPEIDVAPRDGEPYHEWLERYAEALAMYVESRLPR